MPSTVESASLEPILGNKFIAGGEDMWIHVFDFHTGEELSLWIPVLSLSIFFYFLSFIDLIYFSVCNKGHHGPVHCVRFAPGGESYASGSEDGTIRIWQTAPAEDPDAIPSQNGGATAGKSRIGVNDLGRKVGGLQIGKDRPEDDGDRAG